MVAHRTQYVWSWTSQVSNKSANKIFSRQSSVVWSWVSTSCDGTMARTAPQWIPRWTDLRWRYHPRSCNQRNLSELCSRCGNHPGPVSDGQKWWPPICRSQTTPSRKIKEIVLFSRLTWCCPYWCRIWCECTELRTCPGPWWRGEHRKPVRMGASVTTRTQPGSAIDKARRAISRRSIFHSLCVQLIQGMMEEGRGLLHLRQDRLPAAGRLECGYRECGP